MILDPLSPNIENHTQDEIIEFWEKTESIANIPRKTWMNPMLTQAWLPT